MAGKVFLVGAGPGDYRLITQKGIECLKAAEVVVYDYLADDRLLRWAPPAAEKIYVGKSAGRHTMRQEQISQLLVDKARAGKCVVRLKGGDPFVFGRGGEEGLLLQENGIPFEVVPGVTSAIAVPAYAGIPVTHRGVAASFAVVTGHEDPTKEKSSIRWDKLATAVDTLVFLMGIGNLPAITQKLIENGRPADTPAAVIRWGTKPEQRTLVTTVGRAAEDVARAGLRPPAIFLVGEVAALREKLRWFDVPAQRPLLGRTVLVTRSRQQASMLTERLEALGARVIERPAIRIQPPADGYAALDAALAEVEKYQWLIFTSANGVEAFFARLRAAGRDARALGYARLAAIGSGTAAALERHGLTADVVPAVYRAEGILESLKGKLPPHAKILLPRAETARETLPEGLRAQGMLVDVVPAYQTAAAAVSEEERAALRQEFLQEHIDWVTFTSSSTVKNFCHMIDDKESLGHTRLACIGPVTAGALAAQGLTADVTAETYTIDGLVEAIVRAEQQA